MIIIFIMLIIINKIKKIRYIFNFKFNRIRKDIYKFFSLSGD